MATPPTLDDADGEPIEAVEVLDEFTVLQPTYMAVVVTLTGLLILAVPNAIPATVDPDATAMLPKVWLVEPTVLFTTYAVLLVTVTGQKLVALPKPMPATLDPAEAVMLNVAGLVELPDEVLDPPTYIRVSRITTPFCSHSPRLTPPMEDAAATLSIVEVAELNAVDTAVLPMH
jgi:hypothetical protein